MAERKRPPRERRAQDAKRQSVRLNTTSLRKKGQLPPQIGVPGPAESYVAIDRALAYDALGWPVVPQRAGEKKPAVRWKEYQTQAPSQDDLHDWFVNRWPNAGMAVILGPVSDLLVVDVDGLAAHDELVSRLGQIPVAPRVMSGSGDPHRFHLYFKHPDLLTKAKYTPWLQTLEFRGQGGIVILPPSMHKSGNRYRWAEGRSPWEIEVPEVPEEILESLRSGRRKLAVASQAAPIELTEKQLRLWQRIVGLSHATDAFLHGDCKDGPDWNGRLYCAACDLAGLRVTIDQATPLLIHGAAPWDERNLAIAVRTIESAFAEPRMSASAYATTQVVPAGCPPSAMPAFAKAFRKSVTKLIPKKRAIPHAAMSETFSKR